MTETFNTIIAIGTIGFQLIIVLLFIFLFTEIKIKFLQKYYLQIGLLLTLVSIIVSLIYSIVLGYTPCLLCWWARIFMFPQFLLFLVAVIRKDVSIFWYSGVLSLAGIIVSGYHTFIERGGTDVLNCSAGGASCLSRYVFEFGYITIPVMALSGFILLFALAIYQSKK